MSPAKDRGACASPISAPAAADFFLLARTAVAAMAGSGASAHLGGPPPTCPSNRQETRDLEAQFGTNRPTNAPWSTAPPLAEQRRRAGPRPPMTWLRGIGTRSNSGNLPHPSCDNLQERAFLATRPPNCLTANGRVIRIVLGRPRRRGPGAPAIRGWQSRGRGPPRRDTAGDASSERPRRSTDPRRCTRQFSGRVRVVRIGWGRSLTKRFPPGWWPRRRFVPVLALVVPKACRGERAPTRPTLSGQTPEKPKVSRRRRSARLQAGYRGWEEPKGKTG